MQNISSDDVIRRLSMVIQRVAIGIREISMAICKTLISCISKKHTY